ncbi:MAG: OPT/YSL family transporter, partial [Algiphilus sp.]
FVIPAWIAFGLFIGAALAAILRWWKPHWAARHLLAVAAGLVAGESLAGVAAAMRALLSTG